MPTGWTTDGTGTWSVGTGVGYGYPSTAGEGTYNARISHGTTGAATKLITPAIDLSSAASAELSFLHVHMDWSGDTDGLKVYYRTSTDGTWTLLEEFTDEGAYETWTTADEIALPNLSSTYQIAFEYIDEWGRGLGIDDVKILPGSSCPKPAGLAATANGQSATLTWISDATQFSVAHSTDPDADPSSNVVTTVSSPTYTMDNLALDQDHYFWVRSNCSATDQSDWTNPVSVHIGYCVPAPTSVDNNGISNVTFGTGSNIVNNDTPKATYTDYTSLSGDVQAGVESTIAITFATGYTYNTYVWVDLDNSLTFDADEVICYGESAYTNPTTLTLTFTIDPNQPAGSYRMRIGSADSGLGSDPTAANPCYSSSYGCFQDYTLNVLAAPNCLIPSGLALTTDGETVTATWNGTASTYNIDINGTVTPNVISPYTFNCALSTTYTVMVQANCDGGETSDWSTPATITTPDCLGGRVIEYSLVDSYGDGWNGNAILVYDECGNLINSLTLESGSSTSGSIELCEGYYEFVFLEGSYKDETSWTFTEGGVTLFEGEGGDVISGDVLYTMGNPTKPTDIRIAPETNRAEVSWTENGTATAWQICLDGNEANPIAANTNPFTLTGLNPGNIYGVKVRSVNGGTYTCWSSDYTFVTSETCEAPTVPTASDITPFAANVAWTPAEGEFEFRYREVAPQDNYFEDGTLGDWTTIDADGDGYEWYALGEGTIPGYNASLGHVTSASYNGSALTPDNYLVSPQVALGGSIGFWACNQDAYAETIGVAVSTASNDDPADFTTIKTLTLPIARGGAYTTDTRSGNRAQTPWVYIYVDLSAYAGQTGYVAIRHYNCTDKFRVNVDNIVIEQPNDEWTVVERPVSPVALTDLTPETDYEVEVRTVCGNNDYSRWMSNTFTTPSNCNAPSNLEATAMVEDATLTWEGYQDAYNVQYRLASSKDVLLTEGFEDGQTAISSTWTEIDLGDASGVYQGLPHNGSLMYGFMAADDPQYLITPELEGVVEGSSFEFYHVAYGNTVTIQIGYSSTTNDVSAFTWGDETTIASGTSYVLASFENVPAGTKYIGIKVVSVNGDYYYFIDDFAVYGPATEYSWQTLNEVTSPLRLERLEVATEYEWQVQGINASCTGGVTEWSEIVTFTTHDYCDDPIDLEAEITGTTATLSWTGYQDSFNLQYRTGEDFEDVSFIETFGNGQGDWTTSNLETENYDGWASGWDILDGFFTFVYTENPPQYLISPELDLQYTNSTLRFEYITFGGETYPETFKVGFSSTTNDITSFTWGDEITATNDEEFEIYTVTVPNDALYFAIQCTSDDKYALVLDNFVVCGTYIAPGEWVDVENPTSPVTLSGLNAETYYDWQVQGVSADCEDGTTDWVSSYFLTDAFNETLELTAGWNWVSFYVETEDQDPITLLQMLEEALGDNAVQIQASDIYTEYDGEGGWWGDLDEMGITPDQTYWIQTNSDVTVVLEGMPVNTAEVEITINPGWNWIGFPSAVEMDINDALIDFEAEEGDQFQASDSYSEYVDGEWWGDVENLIPGQGYWYLSYSDDVKTLVYNTGAKAKRGGIFAQLKNNSIDRKNVSLKNKMAIRPMLKSAKSAAKKIILKK